MSFENNLTLKNALDADVTFIRLFGEGNKSFYTRSDAPLGEPVNLQLGNTMAPAGLNGNDKVLVKASRVKVDAETGKLDNAVVNLTVSASRRFSTAEIMDLVAHVKSLLIEANLVRMRRGES